VLAELWRGAMSRAEVRFLEDLEKNHVNLAPTENNWIESGHVLSRIRQAHGFNVTEMRELHFDVLIALTARSYGVTLITSNRADFEMIRSYRDFELEIW
jgi:predicted nucleic acid-binding protein